MWRHASDPQAIANLAVPRFSERRGSHTGATASACIGIRRGYSAWSVARPGFSTGSLPRDLGALPGILAGVRPQRCRRRWQTLDIRASIPANPGELVRHLDVCPSAILSHRITPHLDAMGVMNEPVKDTVGQGRIADLFVPT